MFPWIMLVYGALLMGGTWLITHRTAAVEDSFQANRDLPFNHRIIASDLTVSPWYAQSMATKGKTKQDFVGKYITGRVRKGQSLRSNELAASPVLTPDADKHILLIGIDGKAVVDGRINAGSEVALCAGSPKPITRVTVRAVLCTPAGGVSCLAAIDVSSKELEALAKGKAVALMPAGACT